MNTEFCLNALKCRIQSYRHIMFWELPNYSYGDRRVDAITIMCGDKQFQDLTAFEIKVSRADWLKEKKDLEKPQFFRNITQNFYYVCPLDLIDFNEIPSWAGLLYVYEDGKTRIIKKAQLNSHYKQPSWELVKRMICHIGRKDMSMSFNEDIIEKWDNGRPIHSKPKEFIQNENFDPEKDKW